jgi:hypothetical protein
LDDVIVAKHASAAVPGYKNALKRCLELMPDYLIRQFEKLRSTFEDQQTSATDPQVKATLADHIDAAEEQIKILKGAPSQLQDDQLRAAYETLSTALSEHDRLAAPSPQGRPVVAAAAAAGAASKDVIIPDISVPLPIGGVPITSQDIEKTRRQIGRSILVGDLLFALVVVVIAAVLGVVVLWGGNASWGSETDLMVALLWGLGLHTLASGATGYQGLDDLASKLR